MPLRALLLWSAVLAGCAPPSLKSLMSPPQPKPLTPEDAVLPYSYELENAQPFARPFLARFEKDDRSLFFVAANHGCDPKTFRLIDDVLATHRVRLVVVEGFPAGQGINPPEYSRLLPGWAAADFCKGGGEPAYAAFRAAEHGVSFVGGEPDEHTLVDAALKHGFTPEDLLGFYFVRQLPQFRRDGTLAAKGLDASFSFLIAAMAERAGLEKAGAQFSLDEFRDWYQKKQGKTFDAAALDDEEPAPVPSGKYFTQRISTVVGIVRDRVILQRIASFLASHRDLLVVYGGSHFPTLRPAFELLMGKPVEIRPGGE